MVTKVGTRIRLTIVLLTLIATVIVTAFAVALWVGNNEGGGKPIFLKTFSSKDEIASFINTKIRMVESQPFPWKPTIFPRTTEIMPAEAPATVAPEYSATNIQVEGVDEADIVKTDGQMIYAASSNGILNIVKAYPPEEMRILSRIQVNGNIIGLFVGGERLAILAEEYVMVTPLTESRKTIIPLPQYGRNFIKVFDISMPEKPTIIGEVIFEGNYVSSRMIDNYIYVILTCPILTENLTALPKWSVNGVWTEIPPSNIYYSDSVEAPSSYTLIAAIDVSDVKSVAIKSVVTGYASCIYMSKNNLYVAYPVLNRLLGEWDKTEIYRIAVNGLRIECKAKGEVPGRVLNQFSMDEYNGFFRVATTITSFSPREKTKTEKSESVNNVYVLRVEDLRVIGEIEGLAPGEQIYSARFMGERCYLVTFKKVDPLFTIDLSDPANPRVLGKLKIPGYSDYLHPYNENYLIGIGKEAVPAEEGDFAWYQGLKMSLFNISDIENPREEAKVVIGDRGTDSPVLRDHHALLFDRKRNLLVIPILEAKIFEEDYLGERPPWAYGRPVFQGAYIFHISPEDGIILRGRITHTEGNEINPLYEVKRILYIGEVLYTVSDGKIKANDLGILSEITEVSLVEAA